MRVYRCRWKSRQGKKEFAMTQLTDKERTAQMNDMRSFDELEGLFVDVSRMAGSVI